MTEEPEQPETEEPEQIESSFKSIMLDTSEILIPEKRMTSVWDADEKASLVASIKDKGILEPLSVIFNEGKYYVVNGANRLMVAMLLEIPKVPCVVQERPLEDVYYNNLVQNMMVGKNNPIEIGEVLMTLVKEHDMTLEEASSRAHISAQQGRKYVRLMSLPPLVQEYVLLSKLGIEHAFQISGLAKVEDQIEVANRAVNWGYNLFQLKDAIKSMTIPEHEPEEGHHEFDTEGRPTIIYPKCPMCGKEVSPEAQRTVILHAQCKVDLYDALQESAELDSHLDKFQSVEMPEGLPSPSTAPLPQPSPPLSTGIMMTEETRNVEEGTAKPIVAPYCKFCGQWLRDCICDTGPGETGPGIE